MVKVIAEEDDFIESEEIKKAIKLLEENGYIIGRNYNYLVGKWVAFHQEGMEPVLHGRVLKVDMTGFCTVRCPNAERRFTMVDEALEFFDTKRECYSKYPKKRK